MSTTHGVQITQHELQTIYELDRDIAHKQEQADHLKSNLKALLMARMPIEPGRFDARLKWRTVFHPAWKQFVIDRLGPQAAEDFRRASPSNRLCDVMVEEHATMPLWNQGTEESGSEGK